MTSIFKLQIKEKWFKFLFFQFYKKQTVELYFDYLENRIYYKDKKKNIPTGKDLCRSIKMIFEMIKRIEAFSASYTVIEDNLNAFVINLIKSQNQPEKIIFGTNPFDVYTLIELCKVIGVDLGCIDMLKVLYNNYNDKVQKSKNKNNDNNRGSIFL